MRRPITALLAAALLALAAGDAQAAVCQTQPGQGAIDQYCEIVPSGAGDRPSRPDRRAPELSQATKRQLREAGTDGAIVEALATTSPAPQSAVSGARANGGTSAGGGTGSGSGSGSGSPGGGSSGVTPGSSAAGDGQQGSSLAAQQRAQDPVPAGSTSRSALDALFGDPFGGPIGGTWVLWATLGAAAIAGAAAWRRRSQWS